MFRQCKKMLGVVVLVLFVTSSVSAQNPQTRSGFWFSAGLGSGTLGCEDCDESVSGGSGQLALGGTLSDKFLLGGSINAWGKSDGPVTLTFATVTVAVRFYPSATGGFFLTGGAGYASAGVNIDLGSAGGIDTRELFLEDEGKGAFLGLGYDFRVGSNISITPFLNGFGGSFDGGDISVGQIGVGLTVH